MDQFLPALLTGAAIGAVITGAITLLKPLVDYWISLLGRRWTVKTERRAVVEGVVDGLRRVRLDHLQAGRERRTTSNDLLLEAADSALLIHDRAFAKYLSLDIENTNGFSILARWKEQNGDLDGTMTASETARSDRWNHLKMLVERASDFAVTGKWDRAWATQAENLRAEIEAADTAMDWA